MVQFDLQQSVSWQHYTLSCEGDTMTNCHSNNKDTPRGYEPIRYDTPAHTGTVVILRAQGGVMSYNTHKLSLISFWPILDSSNSNHFCHPHMTSEIPGIKFHAQTQYLSTPDPEHIL